MPFTQATVESLHPGDADYDAVAAIATTSVQESLNRPMGLEVERLDRLGYWVFVLGRMRDSDGGVPPLGQDAGTPDTGVSLVSDAYAALFRQDEDGCWQMTAETIGPGDVAWLTWPQKYGVPGSVLGF